MRSPPVDGVQRCDIVVVGGGVAGLHAALALAASCDLVSADCLYVGIGAAGVTEIDDETKARVGVGLPTERLDADALAHLLPGHYDAALSYSDAWAMDAFGYCQGLRRTLLARGVRIFEDSPVIQVQGATMRTAHGEVEANQAVVCVDRIARAVNARANARVYHAQTVLAVSEPLSSEQVATLFPTRRFQVWDTSAVYTYYRLTGDDRLLLGGGSLMSTFARRPLRSPRVVRSVIRAFLERFPGLAPLEWARWWPGFIDVTRDLMPIVDVDPQNPGVHYVLGCPGLPWAAWAGDHAARRVQDPATPALTTFFGWKRPALVPSALSAVLGKPTSFALGILGARAAG